MGDKQMNLFMKKADQEPKIKVPAPIEKEARNMLEPEEQKNVIISSHSTINDLVYHPSCLPAV